MQGRLFWNENIEALSQEQLKEVQWQKLKKQIRYCFHNTEFYHKKFLDAGAYPEDIKDIEDFRKLPTFLDKEEDRQIQEESRKRYGHSFGLNLCADPQNVRAVHSTSGTTGVPTFYAYSKHDIETQNEVFARGFWRNGFRPGDYVIHGFGLSMWLGGLAVIRGLEHLGCLVFPVGAEGGTERFLSFASLSKPKCMVCTPSFAEYLIRRAPEVLGMEVGELGIEKIVTAGEPGAGLPEVRKLIEEAYGCQLYDAAGGPWGMWTASCDAHEYQGLHSFSEDYCPQVFDLIDPQTRNPIDIVEGAVGEVVITALEWEASPPMRYAFGDVYQVSLKPCPHCGHPWPRFKFFGRLDDLLIVKGVNLYPAAVHDVLTSFVPRVTGEMRIILETPPPRVVPPLKMKVEYGQAVSENHTIEIRDEIAEAISAKLRVRPKIEMVPPNSLPKDPSKKLQLLERKYHQE